MSWQYSDAPNHIAPEVGPSLLTGDGPWSGVVLEPGAVYALSVEVNAPGETTVGWGVAATDGSGGEYVLADPADAETVPGGQWVTVTRNLPAPAFPTTATVTLAVPTGAEARNPSMGARTGRTILTVPGDVLAENIMASGGIIAGTPGGARVELTEDGLVAYDATGTQTAHIAGEEGVFVGGEFRTSDTLPGQVTLSDTANVGTPGLSVEPEDSTGYDVLPSIGPGPAEMHISGGVSTDGAMSGAQFGATGTSIYHNGPGANGTGSWVLVNGDEARLAYREDRANVSRESGVWVRPHSAVVFTENATGAGQVSATPTLVSVAQVGVGDSIARSESRVSATPDFIVIERKAPGSVGRHRLLIDDDGVWVQNVHGPNPVSYNLLETASVPAPEIVPVTGSNGWSSDGSPTGGIIVTHSTTGRTCTARLRITRTGASITATSAYQTIGSAPGGATMWIPPELRIPATDYFGIRIPQGQPNSGLLFVDYSTGEFRIKSDSGSAVMSTGNYFTVDLTWFIPN